MLSTLRRVKQSSADNVLAATVIDIAIVASAAMDVVKYRRFAVWELHWFCRLPYVGMHGGWPHTNLLESLWAAPWHGRQLLPMCIG